jgi:hypothetical protein
MDKEPDMKDHKKNPKNKSKAYGQILQIQAPANHRKSQFACTL